MDARRTGEERYFLALVQHPIRANKRRKDVPAQLLYCLNAVLRQKALTSPQEFSSVPGEWHAGKAQ